MYHVLNNPVANIFVFQLINDAIIPGTFIMRPCPFSSAVNQESLFLTVTFSILHKPGSLITSIKLVLHEPKYIQSSFPCLPR